VARVMTYPSPARKLETTTLAGTTVGRGFGAGRLAGLADGERAAELAGRWLCACPDW
jgi:hypothetical protein